jgi:hypothetical protein
MHALLLARSGWSVVAAGFCVDPDALGRVIACKSQLVTAILQTLCNIAKIAVNSMIGHLCWCTLALYL